MSIYSSRNALREMEDILKKYLRLPFSSETIPGSIMEAVLAHVRGAQVLNTYDFVDVISPEESGALCNPALIHFHLNGPLRRTGFR